LWVFFALLEPDPSPATQINADPDTDPDPKNFLLYPYPVPVPVAGRRGWSESSFSIAPPDPYTLCSPAYKRKNFDNMFRTQMTKRNTKTTKKSSKNNVVDPDPERFALADPDPTK
jgi:hypothetical protein